METELADREEAAGGSLVSEGQRAHELQLELLRGKASAARKSKISFPTRSKKTNPPTRTAEGGAGGGGSGLADFVEGPWENFLRKAMGLLSVPIAACFWGGPDAFEWWRSFCCAPLEF